VLRETMTHKIGGTRGLGRNLDACHAVDHLVWLGDLNYRLDLSYLGISTSSHAEHVEAVVDMARHGRFAEMLRADQLLAARAAGDAFVGFVEGAMPFGPTFKVQRQKGIAYKAQRTPSYCDRILWKSMPPCVGRLTQTFCHSVPEVSTSDHKPLVAAFELAPSQTIRRALWAQASVRISRLVLRDIVASDFTGTSDPFCVFYTHPEGLIIQGVRAPRTTVKYRVKPGSRSQVVGDAKFTRSLSRSLSPSVGSPLFKQASNSIAAGLHAASTGLDSIVKRMSTRRKVTRDRTIAAWADDEVPWLQVCAPIDALQHACLLIAIFDWDRWKANDPLGVVTVPLKRPSAPRPPPPDANAPPQAAAARNVEAMQISTKSYVLEVDEPIVLGHRTSGTGRLTCQLHVASHHKRSPTKSILQRATSMSGITATAVTSVASIGDELVRRLTSPVRRQRSQSGTSTANTPNGSQDNLAPHLQTSATAPAARASDAGLAASGEASVSVQQVAGRL